MNITRRDWFRFTAGVMGLYATSAPSLAAEKPVSGVWLYDGCRVGSDCAVPSGYQAIDVSEDEKQRWKRLRSLPSVDQIDGAARWSDFVMIRSHLESQHYRLITFQHVDELCYFQFMPRRPHQLHQTNHPYQPKQTHPGANA